MTLKANSVESVAGIKYTSSRHHRAREAICRRRRIDCACVKPRKAAIVLSARAIGGALEMRV